MFLKTKELINSFLFVLLFLSGLYLYYLLYFVYLSINFSVLFVLILVNLILFFTYYWFEEFVSKLVTGIKQFRFFLLSIFLFFISSELILFGLPFWCSDFFQLSSVTDFLSVPTTVENIKWFQEPLYATIFLLAFCCIQLQYKFKESVLTFYIFFIIVFFFSNQFIVIYNYYCIIFSSLIILLIVNIFVICLIYKDQYKVNLGLWFPTLKIYFYIYFLFYFNLFILSNLYSLNNFFYVVNLNYYFNFISYYLLYFFSYLEWIDSEFYFKLNSNNYLEMNTNNPNNTDLSIESSKVSLASKLSGVDYLPTKDNNLSSDEKTIVCTLNALQQMSIRSEKGYFYCPSIKFENSCSGVTFDGVWVSKAGLDILLKKSCKDAGEISTFMESHAIFYECKVLINGVIKWNSIDVLNTSLKYFQSGLIISNQNTNLKDSELNVIIEQVNGLLPAEKETYMDTKAQDIKSISLQKAKQLAKQNKFYPLIKENNIQININQDFNDQLKEVSRNESFFEKINSQKYEQINNFKTIKHEYYKTKLPVWFQKKSDCWLDLLSSDPSDNNRSNKRIYGFNSNKITYLNSESLLKVSNYSKLIKPKNNEVITPAFNTFLNQHQDLSYSANEIIKIESTLLQYIKIYFKTKFLR